MAAMRLLRLNRAILLPCCRLAGFVFSSSMDQQQETGADKTTGPSMDAPRSQSCSSRRIAVIVHQEHSRPGRVGALLEARGYQLERLCPNLGCTLPDDPSGYA